MAKIVATAAVRTHSESSRIICALLPGGIAFDVGISSHITMYLLPRICEGACCVAAVCTWLGWYTSVAYPTVSNANDAEGHSSTTSANGLPAAGRDPADELSDIGA